MIEHSIIPSGRESGQKIIQDMNEHRINNGLGSKIDNDSGKSQKYGIDTLNKLHMP